LRPFGSMGSQSPSFTQPNEEDKPLFLTWPQLFLAPQARGRTYPSNRCGRTSGPENKKCGPVPGSGKIEKSPGNSRNGKILFRLWTRSPACKVAASRLWVWKASCIINRGIGPWTRGGISWNLHCYAAIFVGEHTPSS
jgi:hypothetical protein